MTGQLLLGTAHSLLQANWYMAGHKRAGGDELLCGSNSNAKKAKQQITKATFEKRLKRAQNGALDTIVAAM